METRPHARGAEVNHAIPDMTDPLGAHWRQPSRDEILVDERHAVMRRATLQQLHEYSRSFPTGTYTGKMWRRSTATGEWFLCWYGDMVGTDQISVQYRPVLLV
jgi:hypothetical protein